MLFCRDQLTGEQLAVDDSRLSKLQQAICAENHPHSSRSKAHGAPAARNADITKGDLVFVKSDGDKNKSRDIYLVMDIQGDMAVLQKLNDTKFHSLRYDVPLTNVYPAIKPGFHDKPSLSATKTCTPVASCSSSSSSSDDSSDEDDRYEEEEIPPRPTPSGTSVAPPRRSTRTSRKPQRYGVWVHNASDDLSDE